MTFASIALLLLKIIYAAAGQLERYQIRKSAKAEITLEAAEELIDAMHRDSTIAARLRDDPVWFGGMRRKYLRF